jgi:hypothetical protein
MTTISPNILYRNDNFLSLDEIIHYQNLLKNKNWGLSSTQTLDTLMYISQDLYNHYRWDGNWDAARWLDSTPSDWEKLYDKISEHLPPHYIHWVDVKLTGPLQGGTPIHKDREPDSPGGDTDRFSKSISVVCNLNTEWDQSWGGGFVTYKSVKNKNNSWDLIKSDTIPIVPGQLLIFDNCYHSIELITEPARCRASFILHVLQYKQS